MQPLFKILQPAIFRGKVWTLSTVLNQEPQIQFLTHFQLSLCNLVQSGSEFKVIC